MANSSSNVKTCFCIECARAKVFQYAYDPIIAECDDGTRNVACAPVKCGRSLTLTKIRCIENLPKKIGF